MADNFTITLEYDRGEILLLAEHAIEADHNIYQTKRVLTAIFPAWDHDTVTSCKVELMFRKEGGIFFELFTAKLAEAENRELTNAS